jgi:tRNA(Ile)-lysidine synthase
MQCSTMVAEVDNVLHMRKLPAGTYIIAVSGGVDSVVLLDMLTKSKGDTHIIVAHFNHGMRETAASDAEFVRQLAQTYGLAYEE